MAGVACSGDSGLVLADPVRSNPATGEALISSKMGVSFSLVIPRSMVLTCTMRTIFAGFMSLLMISSGWCNSYTTSFPHNENPISENGNWINGGTTGLDWTNMRTAGGVAVGTQPGNASGESVYADSTAVLIGSWGLNQSAQGTVYVASAQSGAYEEVAIRLNTTIQRHSITGYEICASVVPGNAYVQIVRWNGPLGSWTLLDSRSIAVHNGDVLGASNSSGTITASLNGQPQFSVTDTTYSGGSPGIGCFLQNAVGINGNYGFSDFSASDSGSAPTPPPSGSGSGPTPSPTPTPTPVGRYHSGSSRHKAS
jgi:hypothetical protein